MIMSLKILHNSYLHPFKLIILFYCLFCFGILLYWNKLICLVDCFTWITNWGHFRKKEKKKKLSKKHNKNKQKNKIVKGEKIDLV